jgi:hypothetical protein
MSGHLIRVPFRVRDPGVGIRRKISVIGEDILTGDIGRELNKQALSAQPDMQRVEHLSFVEALGRDITLAERGHPQVDKCVRKFRAAQAARMQ